MNTSPSAAGGSSNILVAVYWLVVIIPLAWGVYQTAQKSVPLFHATAALVVAAPAGGAAATPPEK